MSSNSVYEITGKSIHEAIGTAPVVEAFQGGESFNPVTKALELVAQFAAPNLMRVYREEGGSNSALANDYLSAGLTDASINVFAAIAGKDDATVLLSTKLALNFISSLSWNSIKEYNQHAPDDPDKG